jgi:hypothetical protein
MEHLERSSANPKDPSSTPVEEPNPGSTFEQRWVAQAQEEIDGYLVELRRLTSKTPEQVFIVLSGISARLVELRVQTFRSTSRRLAALRSHEIDPLLDQCDRAFRLHSRLQSVRSLDWELAKGQV